MPEVSVVDQGARAPIYMEQVLVAAVAVVAAALAALSL